MTNKQKDSHPFGFNKPKDDAAAKKKSKKKSADPGKVKQASENEVRQFITPLMSFEQQVGQHVMRALSIPDTVAVVTAIVVGSDGQQRVVSASLDPAMMEQVQTMLGDAAEQRDEEVPCLGFHCFINRKGKDEEHEEEHKDEEA